jgi:hypothetical protein
VLKTQTQYSLGNARSYFAEPLVVGDYYADGQTIAGRWFGRGCERLGLAGRVGESEFHPSGSEQRLVLIFATHEVQIHGYALRRLVVVLQRRELALITPLSSSARPTISDGQTVIRQISVSEVKNPEAATPGHAAAKT